MEATVKERPILFSGEMVRAILAERKKQTRRVIKPFTPAGSSVPVDGRVAWGRELETFQNEEAEGPTDYDQWFRHCDWDDAWYPIGQCPYGKPGDRLWVRETWADLRGMGFGARVAYRAEARIRNGIEDADSKRARLDYGVKWRSSIHMPRWASRLTLEITDVRVERLQEITSADAIAEGCTAHANSQTIDCDTLDPRDDFANLWDSINAKRGYPWESNPWVWVVEFKMIGEEE